PVLTAALAASFVVFAQAATPGTPAFAGLTAISAPSPTPTTASRVLSPLLPRVLTPTPTATTTILSGILSGVRAPILETIALQPVGPVALPDLTVGRTMDVSPARIRTSNLAVNSCGPTSSFNRRRERSELLSSTSKDKIML